MTVPGAEQTTDLAANSGTDLLLLSGGHDSIALAAWHRPAACLTIDYGQRPVAGELRASRAVARALNLPWFSLRIDLSPVGSGLLHPSDDEPQIAGSSAMTAAPDTPRQAAGSGAAPLPPSQPVSAPVRSESGVVSPSPEWWPFRNQLLVSLAAAWALPRGYDRILVGSVAPDGARHQDGTAEFYERLDAVTAYQEGAIQVAAPAVAMTTAELVTRSGVTDGVLAFAHSCHIDEYSCGRCPGCHKQALVLDELGRLR